MAKKCEKCRTPAVDDQSEFCNRCGSVVREEPRLNVPVCLRCGIPAPNNEVLFCNRCGTAYPAAEPKHHYPLCPRCGNVIRDELSGFCNRCGSPVRLEPESTVTICGTCGNPAPDNEALFCNRCGTGYKKEQESPQPVCPQCGCLVPDELARFCNRCGATIAPKQEHTIPVCITCGARALDAETLFCNRCGTAFTPPGSGQKSAHHTAHPHEPPAFVKISRKKSVPVVHPDDLWDPVPGGFPPAYSPCPDDSGTAPAPRKYAHLPLVADELAGGKVRDDIIEMPGNKKKYAHLPMIADELNEKQSPRLEIESPYYPGPPREKKAGKPKKGLFDLLKK